MYIDVFNEFILGYGDAFQFISVRLWRGAVIDHCHQVIIVFLNCLYISKSQFKTRPRIDGFTFVELAEFAET